MTLPQADETHLPPSPAPLGGATEPAASTGQGAQDASSAEIREREISALIRRKRLAPDDRANLAAIRQALYGFLDDFLE
jgi:hypothetical protein